MRWQEIRTAVWLAGWLRAPTRCHGKRRVALQETIIMAVARPQGSLREEAVRGCSIEFWATFGPNLISSPPPPMKPFTQILDKEVFVHNNPGEGDDRHS